MLQKKSPKSTITVKTLCKKVLNFSCVEALVVSALKREICSRSSSLTESDLDIVSAGKILNDGDLLHAGGTVPVFVIVRSQATSTVELTVKEGSITHRMKFPVNMRISEMKRRLYHHKITKLKPAEARIILNSRVMHDSSLIGDYLLGCRSAEGKPTKTSDIRLYISKTLNLNAEVNVALELPNLQMLRFSIEVGDSLCYVQDILERQFGLTRDISTQLYLENGTPLSPSLSLFDYGVKPGDREVKMKLRTPRPPVAGGVQRGMPGPVVIPMMLQVPQAQGKPLPALVVDLRAPQVTVGTSQQLNKRPMGPQEEKGGAASGGMFKGMKRGFLSNGKKTRK